ncbi:peptidoglycan DD-metalloendopeptidase family protein [bacterium]|nr:peptidoglycan DD-metalloendopeptidase family protein [bacterium]
MTNNHFRFQIYPILILLIGFVSCICQIHGETSQNLDDLIASRNDQLNKLLSEKKDTQSLISDLKNREWGVIEILKALNNNIKNNLERLNSIELDIGKLEEDMILTSNKISGLELEIKEDENRIRSQLHALFYLRKMRNLTLFIGISSLEHFFRNQKLIQFNAELDAKLVARLKQNLGELENEVEKLKTQKISLSALKKTEEEQKKLLAFEKEQQFAYIRHIRQDKSIRIKYLREIQVELERLNDVIYSLEMRKTNETKAKQFTGLFRYKYSLPSPVTGKMVHRFEQKNSKYFTLFKRGVLIETQKNEKVRSILSGKVVWSGPFHGYRNLVILDHGKGSLSVYGNLEEVFVIVDDVIDQNYILGTVGFDDIEERYLFYFETRYNKRAVNPEQWLKKPVWK